MSDYSPMMRRIRNTDNDKPLKFKIPKKGRIRLLIVLLLFAVALRFSLGLRVSGAQGCAEPDKKQNGSVHKSDSSAGKKADTAKKSDSRIDFSQVSAIVKQSFTGVLKTCDTVNYKSDTLVFHYALDSSLQKLGNSLMNRYKPLYGAIVALHPGSGSVLSIVTFKNDSVADLGNLLCRSIFPAASVFKTITAAAAIEDARFNAQSLLQHAGRNHTLYRYQLEKELKQFDEISLEKAYALSINPVFARIGMYSLGKQVLENTGNRFGFNTAIPFELEVEKSSMGSPDSLFHMAEIASGFNQQTTLSPLHGALMASAVCEDGRMPYPFLVDSVTRKDSCIYKAQRGVWRTVVKKNTAAELRKMMIGVSSHGTARKSFKYMRNSPRFDNIEYGGKTGSVDKDSIGRVDWFVGFARDPQDHAQRIAVGVVTVHGAYWTVHSSFIAAEYFRCYLRAVQQEQEKRMAEKNFVITHPVPEKMQQRAEL